MSYTPGCVVVQLKQGDREQLHVFRDGEHFCEIVRNTREADGEDGLRSGIWTKKSFLHSLGLVICAGTKGY